MSKIVITGARGFIGKHLARWLSRQGNEVVGLGHGRWSVQEAAAWGVSRWIEGDIQFGNLRLLQQTCGTPDVVYHLAGGASVALAIANPREDFYRTVTSTVELLEWLRAKAPKTRLVAVSSAAVYGSGYEGRISEDTTLKPCSPYGHHKQIMEETCQSYASSYGVKVSVARLFSVFGAELKKQLLWDACSQLVSGVRPVLFGGSGQELRDWVDVRDVVRALDLIHLQASAEVPIFNVGTGTASSVSQIVSAVANLWPVANLASSIRFSGLSRPGDPFSLVADLRRLIRLAFVAEISLDQGLADYVRWFQSQMQVPK